MGNDHQDKKTFLNRITILANKDHTKVCESTILGRMIVSDEDRRMIGYFEVIGSPNIVLFVTVILKG